jgi:hypothetical protein
MTWLITPQLKVLNGVPQETILGIPFGGGYFAGYISHTANGSPTHALIVAPRATGFNNDLAWKTTNTSTAGATSTFDGVANTAAIVAAGIADHPAANFCVGLAIGGFTDWYLPARLELDIAYYNLKPTTANNNTTAGINAYSVPTRTTVNTASSPAQTSVLAFQSTGAEWFTNGPTWSSTESSSTQGVDVNFETGSISGSRTKGTLLRVRAFRRIAL